MVVELRDYQIEAIDNLNNGNILWGGMGSGKTTTALGYYMKKEAPKDVIVITTAKKRDSLDWYREAAGFGIGREGGPSLAGTITVDSWNNIDNYVDKVDAFFIFDEQRLVGRGAWVKAFLKIAKNNNWILLTATPGDVWLDYAPVFVANGFFKSIWAFKYEHVMYEPFRKYPVVRMYLNERQLEEYKNKILVEMMYEPHTERMVNYITVGHDEALLNKVQKERWNVFTDKPCKDVSELFRVMRRIVNSDPNRLDTVLSLMKMHPRLIVFYNFNYELEILRGLAVNVPVYEWNGHKKDDIPDSDRWVYLVQYVAGCEGWNCITTDAMVLYSMTYSYKNFTQAQGRIDRLNTEYTKLYYYVFVSNSKIDRAIKKSLGKKRNFNERKFLSELEEFDELEEEVVEVCQI